MPFLKHWWSPKNKDDLFQFLVMRLFLHSSPARNRCCLHTTWRLVRYYENFEIDDTTGKPLTRREVTDLHYDRLQLLQRVPWLARQADRRWQAWSQRCWLMPLIMTLLVARGPEQLMILRGLGTCQSWNPLENKKLLENRCNSSSWQSEKCQQKNQPMNWFAFCVSFVDQCKKMLWNTVASSFPKICSTAVILAVIGGSETYSHCIHYTWWKKHNIGMGRWWWRCPSQSFLQGLLPGIPGQSKSKADHAH